MGFTETTVRSSLAIFATFLLLSTAAAARRKTPVSPFCKSAADRALCTNMVKGAKKWPDAMTNMITAAIEKAKAGKPIAYGVAVKLPGDLLPQTKKSINSVCTEAYDTLIYNLQECLGFVNNDPTSALKYHLSSLTLFDCTNALEEFGVSVPEVTKFDDELLRINNNLVAVLEKNRAYN